MFTLRVSFVLLKREPPCTSTQWEQPPSPVIFPHSKPAWVNCFKLWLVSSFVFVFFLTLLLFFNTSLWTFLGAWMMVGNERVSNLFICSHGSVCDFFSVVHLHRSRLQLVGESEKKEKMAHLEKVGFHSKSISWVHTDSTKRFNPLLQHNERTVPQTSTAQ